MFPRGQAATAGGATVAGRVVASDLYLPQDLRWHDDALWFTDSYGGTVCRVGSGAEVVARMPGRPGGLGWTRDGTLLVVAMERRSVLAVVPGGGVSLYADLSQLLPAFATDLLVDPLGRAYVANLGFDPKRGEPSAPTHLVQVARDGSLHAEAPELMSPSGAVLVDDGETMIVTETLGDRVTAMRVAADGHLEDPQVIVDLPEGSRPTGIAVEAGGRLWVACTGSARAVAVTRDGEIDAQIEFPGEAVYGAIVGGAEYRTLFLAVAARDDDVASRTPTGRIEAHSL
jgi:sugar lactone lactonase YvrE